MKKLILSLLLLLFIKTTINAQAINPTAVGTAFELGIPANGVYSIGTGVSAKLEFPVVSPVSISLTAGITSMFYKSNLFNNANTPGAGIFIPLKAGLKYYFVKGVYAEGEAGRALETNYAKRKSFAFSIGPGFIAPVNDKNGIDVSFRYESWANQVRQTVIRVAYRFGG